jgi:hypothetical protein
MQYEVDHGKRMHDKACTEPQAHSANEIALERLSLWKNLQIEDVQDGNCEQC